MCHDYSFLPRIIIKILLFTFVSMVSCSPMKWIQKISESGHLQDFDNYLPKLGDSPKSEYSTFTNKNIKQDEILFEQLQENSGFSPKETDKNEVNGTRLSGEEAISLSIDEIFGTTSRPITNLTISGLETSMENVTQSKDFDKLDPISDFNSTNLDDTSLVNRTSRQQGNDIAEDMKTNDDMAKQEAENGNEESSEEDQNMITGLISAFLGGLSRPDGGVDVEAITGLLGSLSTQNDDGTYDFNGLTELLRSFFGGGGEDGGGSDFGAFLGGIAGAFIQGVAQPPGAKGAGIFSGNLLARIVPALSGPAPPEEGQPPGKPLDPGAFLGGFLQSFLGSSSGNNSGSGGNSGDKGGSKFSIFKLIFSTITSLFTSSSGASKH